MGDSNRNEFTLWASNYLQKQSSAEDVELKEEDLDTSYTSKNLMRGIVKYYAWKDERNRRPILYDFKDDAICLFKYYLNLIIN